MALFFIVTQLYRSADEVNVLTKLKNRIFFSNKQRVILVGFFCLSVLFFI